MDRFTRFLGIPLGLVIDLLKSPSEKQRGRIRGSTFILNLIVVVERWRESAHDIEHNSPDLLVDREMAAWAFTAVDCC